MPPIRSQNSQNSSDREGRVVLAIKSFQNGQFTSLRAAASTYSVPEATVRARMKGTPYHADKRPTGHKLTQFEEDSLAEWILSMDLRRAAPRPSTVREMANILLADRGSTLSPTVGKNWPSTFVQRREELRTRYSRRYDYQRA